MSPGHSPAATAGPEASSHPAQPHPAQPHPAQPHPAQPHHSPEDELEALERALTGPADAAGCARLAALAQRLPGRRRQVITRLAEARTSAAIDTLLSFPPEAPGVVEGIYHGIRLGLVRELGGRPCPEHLALEFRHSRARAFPGLLAHARAAFPEHLETLTVDDRRSYRLALWASHPGSRRSLRALLQAHGGDLAYLHQRLARLRGARLWLNGWRFDADGPWRAASQIPLVQAWIDHASQAPA